MMHHKIHQDKLCHVRPILDDINDNCLTNYQPYREQSIDKGMIAFKGRLSSKQYLPAKPTKFESKFGKVPRPATATAMNFKFTLEK